LGYRRRENAAAHLGPRARGRLGGPASAGNDEQIGDRAERPSGVYRHPVCTNDIRGLFDGDQVDGEAGRGEDLKRRDDIELVETLEISGSRFAA
jgi:hypothetical protein